MEPFKNLLNPALVRAAAERLHRAAPDFDAKRFIQLAANGLEPLEMKARALHICTALEQVMPANFDAACTLFEAALAPVDAQPGMGEGLGETRPLQDGLRGWILWPVGEYIARHGQDDPARGLAALHAVTQRFTAEFAIRPFIVRHPELVFSTLATWAQDDSAHVRRLVSEGSRPRLPWGLRLQALVQDPSPTLPLLLALQDDPSDYVRRSVANHLNDIAKDHPQRVAQWLEEHLPAADAQRRALLRHASRTLVKAGDQRVLTAWGLGHKLHGTATLAVSPQRISVGDSVVLTLQLHGTSLKPQKLAIDYAVHHVKASGATSAKVFKGWNVELPPHGALTLVKRHSMKLITTRRYHPGPHAVDVQVNGTVVASAVFQLDQA